MLTPWERTLIERKLHEPAWRSRLQRVQDILENEFLNFSHQTENLVVRMVISRRSLKEFSGVVSKIRNSRRENPRSKRTLYDLDDIIGIKVICPYPSDIETVFSWMKEHDGMLITPDTLSEGKVEYERGYRGHHFTVQLNSSLLVNNEELAGVICEVQLKTMLEEAWDAKTHDVTYKRPHMISHSLRSAMKKVSDDLAELDARTQTLKTLILRRHEEERLRKDAVVSIWLEKAKKLLSDLVLEVKEEYRENLKQRRLDEKVVLALVEPLEVRRRRGELSKSLCYVAALVASCSRRPSIQTWAVDLCDELIQRNPERADVYMVKGAVCWVMDRLDDALEAAIVAVERAEGDRASRAKNSYAYWVAEKAWTEGAVDDAELELARRFIDEAIQLHGEQATNYDTKGFLCIATAPDKSGIEEGIGLITKAFKLAKGNERGTAQAFRDRHHQVALIRLETMEES